MKKKMIIATTIPLSLMFFRGQIGILKEAFDVELLSSPGDRLDAIAEEEQVKVHAVSMQREIAPLADVRSLLQLLKLFRTIKPIIVHGNTPKGGLLTMIAGFITRVPHRIYYLHGLRYEGTTGLKRKLLMSMERISCWCATEVFSVSKGVRNTLSKDKIHKKEIYLIGNGSVNGINTSHFNSTIIDDSKQREVYGITKEHTVFGFVGRLAGDKGINELVTSFTSINDARPKCKLLLVGMFEEDLDPLEPATLEKITAHPDIIHAGFQKDIRPFLKIMDIFTFPSYREGFGVSIMEAQAMGVPVISSDITGCNELIKDGYNGLLIPSRSVEELTKAMQKLLDDDGLTRKMASVARAYMEEHYEQTQLWRETLKVYKQITDYV